jgi:general secretion pathway protein J
MNAHAAEHLRRWNVVSRQNREPCFGCARPQSPRLGRGTVFRQQRGFTLLELIVAMMMVAILSMSLYASLRVAFKAKSSAETAIAPSAAADITMSLLRDDLENALPPNGVLAGNFVGTDSRDDRNLDADDLVFYSTADSPEHPAANGEIKNVELTVVTPTGSNDHVLIRRVTRNLLAPVQANPDEEVLCRHVMGFNLRYYTGSVWDDSWDSTTEDNTLPVAVEVTLDIQLAADQPPQRYVRVFPLSCSTAAFDSAVNGDITQ